MGQSLPQCSHITRKRGIYFWRRRLPRPLSGEVAISLRTRRYRLAEHHAEVLDAAFEAELARWHALSTVVGQSSPKQILRHNLRKSLNFDPPKIGSACAVGDDLSYPSSAQKMEIAVLSPTTTTSAVNAVSAGLPIKDVVPEGERVEPSTPSTSDQALTVTRRSYQQGGGAIPASALVEPFFKRRRELDRTTHQVLGQERDTLRLFIEICGDRAAPDYARADISHFLETARKLPSKRGRSPKDRTLTVADFIARADISGEARLSDKTLKRHLAALSGFFRYAVDQGHMTVAQRGELVKEHRFRIATKARAQRDAWSSEELVKLFTSPVWRGCENARLRASPGEQIIRDAKFWLPLLALHHGHRLEEFADLYRRDVGFDEDEGLWFISLQESEDCDEEESKPATGAAKRTLKNDNAWRNVPVHPELVRLGFLNYVQKRAPNPDDPLFPDLPPQGADRKRGPRVTRWFVNYRRAIGVYRQGVAMHSFRHVANTRLRDVIDGYQQERHVAHLLGHSMGGGEGRERYDKGPGLRAVADTLALLRYPELDLSHLHVGGAPAIAEPEAPTADDGVPALVAATAPSCSARAEERAPPALQDFHDARKRWFRRKLHEAHRHFATGQLIAGLVPEGMSHIEREKFNATMTHSDAEWAIETLEEDFASRVFQVAQSGVREIGIAGLERDSLLNEAACSWVMLSLKVVQQARIRWAEGDRLFSPACPPWEGLRAALASSRAV